jgi:hypothetical protein
VSLLRYLLHSFAALLFYVRLHLEPVVSPGEIKSTESNLTTASDNNKYDFRLSRFLTALNRLRFIDMPREMMFFLAYLGYLEMVKDKAAMHNGMMRSVWNSSHVKGICTNGVSESQKR